MNRSGESGAPARAARESFGPPLGLAVGAAVFAGMGLLGWLGPQWNQVLALVVVEAGAVGAGWWEARLAGTGVRALLVAAFSWAVFGVTCTGATIWYAAGRSHIMNVELCIPVLIGLVPLAVVRLVLWLATRRRAAAIPARRFGALDAAIAALVLAVPFAGWALGSPSVAGVQAAAEKAQIQHVLTFDADGRGGVTYQGRPVDRDAIVDLCRQAAAEDPRTDVLLKTPKEIDRAALSDIAFGAVSAGLTFSALQAR